MANNVVRSVVENDVSYYGIGIPAGLAFWAWLLSTVGGGAPAAYLGLSTILTGASLGVLRKALRLREPVGMTQVELNRAMIAAAVSAILVLAVPMFFQGEQVTTALVKFAETVSDGLVGSAQGVGAGIFGTGIMFFALFSMNLGIVALSEWTADQVAKMSNQEV